MAAADAANESPAGAVAVHPLTHEEAASNAERFYAKITQKAPKIDSYYTYRHLERDPEYIEAALWPSYYLTFLDDAILEMFQPPVSPELELWLLEYLRIHFPEKDLFDVMAITSDRTLHPLHIAAALGLPSLCQSLAEDHEDSVNRLSPVGTPLYCALIGPRVFLERVPQDSEPLYGCPSMSQLRTLWVLLDAGASGLNMTRPKFNTTLSVQSIALRVSEQLEYATVFRRLYPPEPGSMGIEIDLDFQKLVTDHRNFKPNNLLFESKWVSTRRIAVQSELLLIVFDSNINECDDPDIGNLLDKIWDTMVQLCSSGGGKMILLAAGLPLHNADDEEYKRLLRLAISCTQEATVERLSSDPRFDPSIKLYSSDENIDHGDYTSDKNDDPNSIRDPHDRNVTLLHSVARDGHVSLVTLLLHRGADINARDYMGRTPLMLCESPDVLQKLMNKGGRTDDADFEGRTIYHYAAACSDHDILAFLRDNDPDFAQNLTTRSLRDGRTPAAQSIIYPLVNMPTTPRLEKFLQVDNHESLRAKMFLLKHGAEVPGSLYCDDAVTLAKAALTWGDADLVEAMQKCGFRFDQVDEDGNNALHLLNFAATPKLVRLLLKDCATLSMQNNNTRSPTETVFTNTYVSVSTTAHSRWTAAMPNPVPLDFVGALDEEVFEELLLATAASTPGCEDQQQAFAMCYSDFYQNVILSWLGLQNMEPDHWPLPEAFTTAMKVFRKLGALKAYKEWQFGNVPAADIANVFCWQQAIQSKWWREIQLGLFVQAISDPRLVGERKSLSEDAMNAFEEMVEWFITEYSEETTDVDLDDVLRNHLPIPEKIKDVPTMLVVCRSHCEYAVFESILCRRPVRWTVPDHMAAAKKLLRELDLDDLGRRANLLMEMGEGFTGTEDEALEWLQLDE
ncbi:hypothetical protein F5X68DRAFT_276595 [Plectosphaerella plurivora]|uniref:Ankyrin repeat protein n=1 Tax=Plectosphaerella plurivora TaxID=936078 RepID=A0A9P8VB05_9PEZI|nr:hypothetical protein F5X68DRAFT_276595 [Plectosphaerella plurivora]